MYLHSQYFNECNILPLRNVFLAVLESVKSKIKALRVTVWWEPKGPLACSVIFFLCPYKMEGIREQSRVPFSRALILFMRAPPSLANHLPKDSIPNIALGIRIWTYKFCGRDTNIQPAINAHLQFTSLTLYYTLKLQDSL